jgi:hypothetical protein
MFEYKQGQAYVFLVVNRQWEFLYIKLYIALQFLVRYIKKTERRLEGRMDEWK